MKLKSRVTFVVDPKRHTEKEQKLNGHPGTLMFKTTDGFFRVEWDAPNPDPDIFNLGRVFKQWELKEIGKNDEDEYPTFTLPRTEGPPDIPDEFCCQFLKQQISETCRGAEKHVTGTEQCPKQIVCYSAKLREYSLRPIGLYNYTIHYCPSCGNKFPNSLRDTWCDELKKLGVSPWEVSARPEEFKTDAWWKGRKL